MQLDYFFFYAEANIVCTVILGILFFHGRRYGTRQEKQIWYERTLLAHILYFLSDIGWAAVLSGYLPRTRFLVILFNLLNFVLLSLIACAWFMYMASSVGLAFRNRPHARLLTLLPMAVSFLALLIAYAVSPRAGESQNLPAWYYPLMIAAPLVYLTAAFVFSMIRARRTESRDEAQLFRLIGLYPLVIMAFGLIQTFRLNAPLFCFGCTVMMLFFYLRSIQTLVSVDALTRLNNRGQISRYMGQARFRENIKAYALMLDIDNFKKINDTYGHAEGDRALVLVSEVLKQAVEKTRSAVFLGRYGGDEFSIFFQCAEGDPSPEETLEAARAVLQERRQEARLPYPLNITYGYDVLRDRNDTLEACLNRADRNLYQNKRAAKVGR